MTSGNVAYTSVFAVSDRKNYQNKQNNLDWRARFMRKKFPTVFSEKRSLQSLFSVIANRHFVLDLFWSKFVGLILI